MIFVLFWSFLGAYIIVGNFLKYIPQPYINEVYPNYVAGWYADLIIISMSSIGVSIAYILYFQTGTLPYLFRYSKLTPSSYLASMYLGLISSSLIIELLLTLSVFLMFSNNGVGVIVAPANIPYILLSLILAGLFMISFSLFLVLLSLRLGGIRLQYFINFIPLVLGYLFFSMFTFSEYPEILDYISPYLSLMLLFYYSYNGNIPPINIQSTQHIGSFELVIFSILLWSFALILVDIYLMRKLYYRSIEEGRIY
ncbi:MAG: hypothetical protein QXL96_05245 [Ignisphaera sp.]